VSKLLLFGMMFLVVAMVEVPPVVALAADLVVVDKLLTPGLVTKPKVNKLGSVY